MKMVFPRKQFVKQLLEQMFLVRRWVAANTLVSSSVSVRL